MLRGLPIVDEVKAKMADQLEGLFLVFTEYLFLCFPMTVVCLCFFLFTKRISSSLGRLVVRCGLVALAFAPGPLGHAGVPFPAMWFGVGFGLKVALASIFITWAILLIFSLSFVWIRRYSRL